MPPEREQVMSKATELKKKGAELLEDGVTNLAKYKVAVPLIFDLAEAARNARDFARQLDDLAANLSDGAAAYAIDHPTALNVSVMCEAKDGITSGIAEIDGQQYRLTISRDAPKRISGGTLTQRFLEGLPSDWVKSKLGIHVTGMKDATEEELAKYDLHREMKRVWSVIEEVR